MRRLIPLVVLLCGAQAAHAQATQFVPASDGIKGAEKTDVEGWAPFLTLTASGSLTDNKAVIGQVDGFSTLIGAGLAAGADYVKGPHLWRNSFLLNESFARTPVVDSFIKTNDAIKLESLYNYFLTKDLGLFGRLSITTSLFETTDVRGEQTTWVLKNGDGTVSPISTGTRQHLSDSGKPLTLNESIGGFADPYRKEWLNISIRAGLGGRSTFADGVLLSSDDKATPEIELVELSDVHQLGLEGFAGANGKLKGGKMSYVAGFSVLYPFVNNDSADRSAARLTRLALEAAVTFQLYSWMSLVYNLNVIRDPQLFPAHQDRVEVQNNLLLTFNLTVVKKPEKAKEPTKEELEIKAQKDRADAAEKRATEAEEKLKAIESSVPPTPPPAETPAPAPTPAP
ncbi:MAG: hypothetical protein QM831_11130 [Kofleriaceae bacterium]